MIIKREYVPFWKLKETDKEAIAIFDKAFNASYLGLSAEEKDKQYQNLMKMCLYQREMGWAFDRIVDVINGFAELDIEKPYDNGLNYEDVNSVEVANKSEEDITLKLIRKTSEGDFIVKIVNIDNAVERAISYSNDIYGKIKEQYSAYKQGKEFSISESMKKNAEFLLRVAKYAEEKEVIGISILQRIFAVGFPRAAKTVDLFEELGLIESSKTAIKGKKVIKEAIEEFIGFLKKACE